jgi:hypothetical protein
MTRSFTVESIYRNGRKSKISGGRYLSDTPSSAARKAFSQAIRKMNVTGRMSLEIHIRETTQGSLHKQYTYRVSKVANTTEADWINGQNIVFKYTTKIKSL